MAQHVLHNIQALAVLCSTVSAGAALVRAGAACRSGRHTRGSNADRHDRAPSAPHAAGSVGPPSRCRVCGTLAHLRMPLRQRCANGAGQPSHVQQVARRVQARPAGAHGQKLVGRCVGRQRKQPVVEGHVACERDR